MDIQYELLGPVATQNVIEGKLYSRGIRTLRITVQTLENSA